jgi:hypothetical protein
MEQEGQVALKAQRASHDEKVRGAWAVMNTNECTL